MEASEPLLAWHNPKFALVPLSSPWAIQALPPRSGPLSAAVQPTCQWTYRHCAAGCSWCRPGQLHADYLELKAEAQHDLPRNHLWDRATKSVVKVSVFHHPFNCSIAGGLRTSSSGRGSDSILVLDASHSTSYVTWEQPLRPVRR